MGYSVVLCPNAPPGEYRDGAAPHARRSWGGKRSNEPPVLPPGLGTRQYYPRDGGYGLRTTSRWLSAGAGQVNDRGERNEPARGLPVW